MDVLRLPVIDALLRWRHIRLALQFVLLALAAVIVLHGLFGPQIAPRNLSTVLTSIHWRGLLVVAVLAIGNLTCAACPMILARDAGRRFVQPRFSWPRQLRRKWLGLGLLVLVLFAYELFDLWQRPSATAWIVLAYFGLALLIDLLFRGAAFCKHVCPIGQFNFVASTMAPMELQVRNLDTCGTCRTYDCIKGRSAQSEPLHVVRRGCELGLFLPAKVGNLDCTFCLDCVHACPHDNIAIRTRLPGRELLEPGRRSGIGRLSQRPDLAALATVFTFAALLNAFAMTAPAFTLESRLAGVLNVSSEWPVLALLFLLSLVLVPALLLAGAAAVTRAAAGTGAGSVGAMAIKYAFTLVPLGLGVWLAHYGFHLLTGALTIVPVTQSAAIDLFGWAALGQPAWNWAGMPPGAVYPVQAGFIFLGACGAAGLVQAVSVRDYPDRPLVASAPWLGTILLLAITALWILDQPMEMRGLALG